MAKNNILWIILGALGIAGLILLLRKPALVAAVPTIIAPGVPAIIPPTIPTTCQGRAIALAMRQLGLPQEELTVRGLRPEDLNLATWSMNLAVANAWNTAINTTVADTRFICITGVSYAGTAAESIRVTAAGRTVAWFNIERVPGITETHHIDITPILVEQNQPIRIEVYASTVSTTDNVILVGTTIEKRGIVLA